MSAENDIEVARQLGEIVATVRAQGRQGADNHRQLLAYIKDVDRRSADRYAENKAALASHVEREEKRLKRIDEKLSVSRFIWLTLKAVALTIALILAMKTGNITDVWRNWKELI